MANQEHLDILAKGAAMWNTWRKEGVPVGQAWPDLNGANLSQADLRGAKLARANLSHAGLSRANLTGANLSRTWRARA